MAIIVKVKEGLYDRGLFYYTQLSNGKTYVKGPEINLLKIGNKLKIRPDPNNNNKVTLGLSRIFEEPKDDDIISIDHSSRFNNSDDPNSSNIGQSCEESLAIHCSINSSVNKQDRAYQQKLVNKSQRNKIKPNKRVHTDAEYPGGYRLSTGTKRSIGSALI